MHEARHQTERLSFLTDGVYAIAITLLVLDVKVPEHLSPAQVLPALLDNIPKFVSYLIAFTACAIGWTFTYLSHGLVVRGGAGHLICTLLSLLAVGLLPFSSALMGNYPDLPWGVAAYGADVALLAGMNALDLTLATRGLPERVDRRAVRVLYGSSWAVAAIAAGTIGLAFLSPRIALYVVAGVTAMIWVEYFFLVGWIGRAIEAIEARMAHHAPQPRRRSQSSA
jgi:uncharacterized membrane protein